MTKLSILLILFTISLEGNCQSILNPTQRKTGIYLNFNEFKTNSPSIAFDLNDITIKEDVIHLLLEKEGFIFYKISGTELPIYRFKKHGTNKQLKTMDYWGFCYGQDVYINSYTHIPKHYFVKLELIGRLCYFIQAGNSTQMKGINNSAEYYEPVEYLVNINTGKIARLDLNMLKSLISKDQELLDEFNNDTDLKNKLLIDYIEKYNMLHMDKIKID